jgi:hypothetical protein
MDVNEQRVWIILGIVYFVCTILTIFIHTNEGKRND